MYIADLRNECGFDDFLLSKGMIVDPQMEFVRVLTDRISYVSYNKLSRYYFGSGNDKLLYYYLQFAIYLL
jgi:hypothetical protein